ncbi:MAG: T9SS type A sorting domain-containing protein [Chitinophagaceae bacterium]|nr:T9SS type A sorting domain-containing protein [Chitinophagaceae bacterium]MCW5926911.1 T9SS type A sorting domain-containing protein [Chitinophagaceae bacterium]
MKVFLPLVFMLCLHFSYAQVYQIVDGVTYEGPGTHNEPMGNTETLVLGSATRTTGFVYEHHSPHFRLSTLIGAWLTDLVPAFPETLGNNTDNFNYQGDNEISGNNSVIFFDNLNFNIGAGNTMHINNHNLAFHGDPEYYIGQAKGAVMIFRHWNSHNGITTTNRNHPVTGAMVFANNAGYTYPAGITHSSHVNGFVSEINLELDGEPKGHGGNFIYPVGNSAKAYPLERSGVFTETSQTITVGWVDGDPNTTLDPTGNNNEINNTTGIFLGEGILSVTKLGFWDWHVQHEHDSNLPDPPFHATFLTTPQTITVSIPGLNHLPVSAGELRLVGYNPTTDKWQNLSGVNGATGVTEGSKLTGTIPANTITTALAVGSITTALPVEFISFTARKENCSALLEWKTGMEQNNSHFLVQRSTNGRDFETIGTIHSKGNSTIVREYRYTDATAPQGTTYYRITQVDFDGKNKSTEIKSLRMDCNNRVLKAYPNPARNQVYLDVSKAIAGVNLLSAGGQTVLRYVPSQLQQGTFSLNVNHIPAGIYILQVIYKDQTTETVRILKQ